MNTLKIFAHSAPDRIAFDEQRTAKALRASQSTDGDSDPARGIVAGVVLGVAMWALILSILWAVFL